MHKDGQVDADNTVGPDNPVFEESLVDKSNLLMVKLFFTLILI